MWQIWLIVAGFFLILEFMTTGFLVFCFSIGALIAMIASFFIKSKVAQAVIFVITSTILLFVGKKIEGKKFTDTEKIETAVENNIKTNAHSVENKIGKVTVDIEPDESKGQVKIDGEIWSAKSFNDTFISTGTEVIIEKIEGVKVIVKPI
jgi:membrane protein implicated in regulation of membrane protease activity